ncbi:hypothetical protein GIB67_019512 [Kingdonia uniflora]|uniref:Auxin-responsive protein n=1 Tax=Kingdonia uniflora TaxID=39325 RepID=A0A7J7N0P6_9MAGN|nr:hypothetical protein GIB67_019512 [Kingdonia uniflora]
MQRVWNQEFGFFRSNLNVLCTEAHRGRLWQTLPGLRFGCVGFNVGRGFVIVGVGNSDAVVLVGRDNRGRSRPWERSTSVGDVVGVRRGCKIEWFTCCWHEVELLVGSGTLAGLDFALGLARMDQKGSMWGLSLPRPYYCCPPSILAIGFAAPTPAIWDLVGGSTMPYIGGSLLGFFIVIAVKRSRESRRSVTLGTPENSSTVWYMGSIIGISDIDPLRWPSSKWRNLQVEWDEAGSVEKPNRICLWDIDTPDNLYQFSSLASSLKRPMHPIVAGTFLPELVNMYYPHVFTFSVQGAEIKWGNVVKRPFLSIPEIETHDLSYNPFPSLASKHLAQNLLRPPSSCLLGAFSCSPQSSIVQGSTPQAAQKCIESLSHQKPHILPSQNLLANYVNPPRNCTNPLLNLDTYITSQIPISEKCQALCTNKIQLSDTEKQKKIHMGNSLIHQNPINQHLFLEKEPTIHVQTNPNFVRHQINSPQLERSTLNGLFPFPSQFLTQYQLAEDWNLQSATFQPLNEFISPEQNPSTIFPDIVNQIAPSLGQEIWGLQSNHDLRYASQAEELSLCPQQEPTSDPGVPKLCEVKETLEESKDRSEIYNNLHFDPSISSDLLDTFGSLGDICFQNPSDCLVCSLSSSQGIQSKITTTSFPDTQDFSLQEFPNTSGGTSSSNVDFDETSLYQNGSWQQLSPHLRTYTKVQKLGSVGRSIDVSSFKNYDELRFAIACMFSLEGLLDDPKGSGWELVYVDYENDVLLVGDDPWEEFVSCVRCIRVVSPSEIQKLGEDNGNLNTVING